jgi:phosphoribosylanthranilate isomerase
MEGMAHAPRIKICGITNREDAEHAAELGVWALGMIFYKASPRRCRQGDALEIVTALRRQVETVGVFVNPHLDDVVRAADQVGFSIVQLHGDEGPASCQEVARRTGCEVIKATQVRSAADVKRLSAYHTDYHLLDTYRPAQRGGTGETFDWELAQDHRGRPLILSGGLNPENVAGAIATVTPWAVDTASGVEREPGRKDHDRVEAFVHAARGTEPGADEADRAAPAAPARSESDRAA